MPGTSTCGVTMNCLECPKAVNNAIIHASHPRGFHKPAQKCEENLIIFLLEYMVIFYHTTYHTFFVDKNEKKQSLFS